MPATVRTAPIYAVMPARAGGRSAGVREPIGSARRHRRAEYSVQGRSVRGDRDDGRDDDPFGRKKSQVHDRPCDCAAEGHGDRERDDEVELAQHEHLQEQVGHFVTVGVEHRRTVRSVDEPDGHDDCTLDPDRERPRDLHRARDLHEQVADLVVVVRGLGPAGRVPGDLGALGAGSEDALQRRPLRTW